MNMYMKNAKQNYLVAEAVKRNLWAKLVPGEGWIPCERSDSAAHPDLNEVIRQDYLNGIEHN